MSSRPPRGLGIGSIPLDPQADAELFKRDYWEWRRAREDGRLRAIHKVYTYPPRRMLFAEFENLSDARKMMFAALVTNEIWPDVTTQVSCDAACERIATERYEFAIVNCAAGFAVVQIVPAQVIAGVFATLEQARLVATTLCRAIRTFQSLECDNDSCTK